MGEYATRKDIGERIKIGTCESMYYLRADQAREVYAEPGNVDPIADAAAIRFRFPFPDEDGIEPGNFDDHARHMRITESYCASIFSMVSAFSDSACEPRIRSRDATVCARPCTGQGRPQGRLRSRSP